MELAPESGGTGGPDSGFSRHKFKNSHYKYVERIKIKHILIMNEWRDREFEYRDGNYKKNQMKIVELKNAITKWIVHWMALTEYCIQQKKRSIDQEHLRIINVCAQK